MGLLKHNGKIEYVDTKSIHRLTAAESTAFLLCSRVEQERHYRAIDEIEDTILLVKKHVITAKGDRNISLAHTFFKGMVGGEKQK